MRIDCLMGSVALIVGLLLFVGPVRSVVFVALPTLPWAIAGAAVAACTLTRVCSNWRASSLAPLTPEQRFWRSFLLIVPLLGMAAQDRLSEFGLTQIWLQPIVLMGVALLAASLPRLKPSVRWLIAMGVAVDFLLGVLLHFALQRATTSLSQQGEVNLADKLGANVRFWGDHVPDTAAGVIEAGLLLAAAAMCIRLARSPRRRRSPLA